MAAMKKKKVVEEPTSKTARNSMRKGQKKDEGFKASGDMNRIIPLAGGEWAYVLDPRNGLTHHVKVGSEKWVNLLLDLVDSEHGPRIQEEMHALGWGDYEQG